MINQSIDELRFSEVVKIVESLDAGEENCPPLKISFLRNITIDPIMPYLKFLCYQEGFKLIPYIGEYDSVVQEVLDPDSALFQHVPEVIVICLRLETLSEKLVNKFSSLSSAEIHDESERILSLIEGILSEIRKNTQTVILLHNFETPTFPEFGILDYQDRFKQLNTIRKLNFNLLDLIEKYESIYLIDIDLLRATIGHSQFIDHRYWHIGKSPYTREAWKTLAKEYMKFIRALRGKNKKCLVLDCDNTLWGGIVGEDGINGIKIGTTYPGSAFHDFQKAILNLYHRGVILAICSKNNEKDVLDVLEQHPDMVLRKDHFLVMKINWNDKVTNLREIAAELNIGLDSVVFVDDSDFEINMIRTMLSEVKTVKLPDDPSLYKDVLNSSGLFDSLTFSEEDRSRNEMYRSEAKRKEAKSQFQWATLEDYLNYLEMEVSIRNADDFSIPRIAQLTQRTNQFNLTTKRYSETDIKQLAYSENAEIRYLHLNDRFGDNGIVGVAILKYEGNESCIDSFLLSCRVIGRRVENVLLGDCIQRASIRGCDTLIGQYRPTEKNGQVADFYPTHGFELIGNNNGISRYFLSLKEAVPKFPGYFKCIKIDNSEVLT